MPDKRKERDTIGWESTNAAPEGDESHAEEPKTRIDSEKEKLGSDERARLADSKRT